MAFNQNEPTQADRRGRQTQAVRDGRTEKHQNTGAKEA